MKNFFKTNLLFYFVMTIFCGIFYPLFVYCVGVLFFPKKISGSLIKKNDILIGSELIAQKTQNPKYFWPRPSAVDYNSVSSGGSNLSQTSSDLLKLYQERQNYYGAQAPQPLLFASASGLDPHIDLESALFQIDRIALHRATNPEKIQDLVLQNIEKKELFIFGEQKLNVLKLNLLLDEIFETK